MFTNKVRFILKQSVSYKNINKSCNLLIIDNINNSEKYSVRNNFIYFPREREKIKKSRYPLLFVIPCFVTGIITWKR